MWPLRNQQRYESVSSEEAELQLATEKEHHTRSLSDSWRYRVVAAIVALFIVAAFGVLKQSSHYWSKPESTDTSIEWENGTTTAMLPALDEQCAQRREWRSLTSTEQQAYISAVLCLQEQPSVLSSGQTSYDDFPWIHSHVGYYTHNSAPFLPWHRYFLHIYETTLREKCEYDGGLVYWDWTIDSTALEHSPVFDPETGFGGDGKIGGEISVGRSGRCLTDGPFKDVNVSFYDVKYNPHCLSRGFRDKEGNLGHIDGTDISPESINEVLSLDKYEDFVALMESRVHDAIPFGIGGDFETFTAPYDPIFFLHHTQLDRLWWLWQQRDGGSRLTEYGGHKQRHSIEMASLDDEITMQGLASAIKVSEVMDTDGGLLCYRY